MKDHNDFEDKIVICDVNVRLNNPKSIRLRTESEMNFSVDKAVSK